jgi:hypothetical protein
VPVHASPGHREIREEWKRLGRDAMKTQAMSRAAASIAAWPQRIYEPEQLEACPKVGPEIRRVRTSAPRAARVYAALCHVSRRTRGQSDGCLFWRRWW